MMKKYYITFLIIIALCVGGSAEAYAQQDASHIAHFPTWGRLYYESNVVNIYGETSNIEQFFHELREWSKVYRNGILVNEDYNAIFVKHFKDVYSKEKQTSKFISLPINVRVTRYDCDLRPYIHKRDKLFRDVLPASITSFTPVMDSDKDVVYISEEAEKLISDFITEPMYKTIEKGGRHFKVEKEYEEISDEDWEERKSRMAMVREYVPARSAHWGEFLYFLSYPQITSFIVGKDGYIINIGSMTYFGTLYFVPWEGEPEEIESWIQ